MKLAFQFISLGFSKGINMPLLLLEIVLISTLLGPADFGKWSLIVAAATMLYSFLMNWTCSIAIKFGSQEWHERQTLTQTFSMRLPFLLLGLIFAILLLIWQPFNWLSTVFKLEPQFGWLIFLYFCSLFLAFEAQSYIQATGILVKQAIATPTITALSIFFLILSYLLQQIDLFWILIGTTILKSVLWGVILCRELYEANCRLNLPKWQVFKKAILFGWPLLPTVLLGYLSNWGNHLILNWYCSIDVLGLWNAAYQWMLGLISVNSILVTALTPWLLKRKLQFKDSEVYYIQHVIPIVLSFWLILMLMIIVCFPIIFHLLMRHTFVIPAYTLSVLALSVLTSVFSSLYSILYVTQNRLAMTLFVNLIMVAVNLILSFALIPNYGILGACIGTFFSYLIGNLLYIADQHRHLRIPLGKNGIFFGVILFFGTIIGFADPSVPSGVLLSTFSIVLFIIIIRKIAPLPLNFVDHFFTGRLQPFGFLIRKVLVGT